MTEFTKIQWTDHTFNPWWGCSRVSPACRNCYADPLARRYGYEVWRRKGPRRMLSDANWRKPLKWNRDAERAGKPLKVFCASMADVFEEHPEVVEARKRLWDLIDVTPWLRWQLLTKRPENVADMAPWGRDWPAHVWLGASVENQRYADERIPILLHTPAAVRFLSCEPLLGPVDLRNVARIDGADGGWVAIDSLGSPPSASISWVIVGGESGPKSRPTELSWVSDIVDQCQDEGVAPFVKQLGTAWASDWSVAGKTVSAHGDRKGGDPVWWPAELRVRKFPQDAAVAI